MNRFEEKKAKFDYDHEVHGQEATLLEDGTVELRFWLNKNCCPEFVKISLEDFLNRSLGDLPEWTYEQNFGWYIDTKGLEK